MCVCVFKESTGEKKEKKTVLENKIKNQKNLENGPLAEKSQHRKSKRSRKKRGARKEEPNDSPEIPDSGRDIGHPQPPSRGSSGFSKDPKKINFCIGSTTLRGGKRHGIEHIKSIKENKPRLLTLKKIKQKLVSSTEIIVLELTQYHPSQCVTVKK